MSKQITVVIPDEIYTRLESASAESMRPVATEAVYRIRLGLDSIMYKDLTPVKATVGEAMSFAAEALKEVPSRAVSSATIAPLSKDRVYSNPGVRKLVKKGLKELPNQEAGGFKTYFKGQK